MTDYEKYSDDELWAIFNALAHSLAHYFRISEDENEPPCDQAYKVLLDYNKCEHEMARRFPSKANGSVLDDL